MGKLGENANEAFRETHHQMPLPKGTVASREGMVRSQGSVSTTAASSSTPLQSAPLEHVVISHELLSRRLRKVHTFAELEAMHALAHLLPDGAYSVLKRLAQLAIELCGAGSAGISMLDTECDGRQIFRWRALAGEFESHEGGTTPRDWSPCGECLKAGKPMLYSYPARFFTYFQSVDKVIVEGLVIPMYADGQPVGTIWIVGHNEQCRFNAEDVRIMTSLGRFVTAALRLSYRREVLFTGEAERNIVLMEFVQRIAGGDVSALETFMDETQPLVFGRALRILSFRADAEEIAADVYSQVWRSAGRYDARKGSVLAWLLNITASRSMDRLRSRARHQTQAEVPLSLLFRASDPDPEAKAESSETTRYVQQVLKVLPFEQRRVIELAYYQGHSTSEIAARLGHPLGTVKTRIRTGLQELRRLLATMETHAPSSYKA